MSTTEEILVEKTSIEELKIEISRLQKENETFSELNENYKRMCQGYLQNEDLIKKQALDAYRQYSVDRLGFDWEIQRQKSEYETLLDKEIAKSIALEQKMDELISQIAGL
jgi:hypothetical protein